MTEKYVAEVPISGATYVIALWDSYPPKKPITFQSVEGDDEKVVVEVQTKELHDVIAEEFKLKQK